MVRRSTWIVICVFATLLGLAWYLQTRPAPDEQLLTPTPEQNLIFDFDASKVIGLRIIGPDGRVFYSIRADDGTWTLIQPDYPDPIDNSLVEANLNQVLALAPLTQLEIPPALEAVGLVSPEYVLEIQLSDGSRRRMEVGNQTPTGSGYYVRFDNTELFVVNKFTLDNVVGMLTELPLLPTPTPELIPTRNVPIETDTPDNSDDVTPTPTP